MPALIPTEYIATVEWLGVVDDREARLASSPRQSVDLGWGGVEGEEHAGLTRPSCSRVLTQYPERGTEIRNVRQLSVVSAEELEDIAAALGVDSLSPALVGASVALRGIPDFTHVPPSSRLMAEDSSLGLCIDMENLPCILPAKGIAELYDLDTGKAFKASAKDRRGVTAWVERPGTLSIGDKLRLHVPGQRAWSPKTLFDR